MNIERIKKVKAQKVFTVVDGVVVALLLAIAILLIVLFTTKKSDAVVVSVDGKERRYSLNENTDISLGCLVVHISGGEVWVTNSNCLDHTCEKTGRISHSGQSIVCLPNKVVITLTYDGDLQWEVGK